MSSRSSVCFLLVVLTAAAAAVDEADLLSNVDNEDFEDVMQISKFFYKDRVPQDCQNSKNGLQCKASFSWKDCGQSGDVIRLQSLTVSPNPIRLPGNVTVSFQWQTTTALVSPISLDLKVEKKIGPFWITAPCGDIPGTCHHADVCSDVAKQTCPTQLPNCHCPFKQGSYNLPLTTMFANVKGIPSGDYRTTAWLKKAGKELGCVYIEMSVA